MPVHIVRQRLPTEWSKLPFFRDALENISSIPVINVQLWFDRKLPSMDSLIFSRSKCA
jgi:15-cis-phytoene desaturase